MRITGISLILITYNYDFIICKLFTYNELFSYIWYVIYQLGCFLGCLKMESKTFINYANEAEMTMYQITTFKCAGKIQPPAVIKHCF